MKAEIRDITAVGVCLRLIYRVQSLKKVSSKALRAIVAHEDWLPTLNRFYNKLNFDSKGLFHGIYSNAFENSTGPKYRAIWNAKFLNSNVSMPLDFAGGDLDWINAISILGHDTEIKQSYETLLKSRRRPNVFFDIGANYGTHSLLMLSQQITTVSFEPNPACKVKFKELCALNNLVGQMETVAVGAEEGSATFWLPESHPWLGTILRDTKIKLEGYDLKETTVAVISVDTYVRRSGLVPDVIKIDTEGNEASVIKGANETIGNNEIVVIFECNELSSKHELWHSFRDLKYIVCRLPLRVGRSIQKLSLEEMISDSNVNYLALPEKQSRRVWG